MASKIQIRRDTFANWNAVAGSVILAAGEIGYETDTRNLKIGDGTSVWSALKYQAPVYSGTNSTLAAETLAIDQTNNRVGIGTASPTHKLTLSSAPAAGTPQAIGTDGTVSQFISYQTSGGLAYSGTQSNHTYGLAANNSGKVFLTPAGNVGIGIQAPLDQLHIEGAGPIIRLKDTTSTTAEYATIDADTSTGSISINANQGNLAAVTGTTLVALKVNTTERLRANATGVTITGAFSVGAGGTVSVPAGTIAGAALVDSSVTRAKLSAIPRIVVTAYYTGTGTFTVPAGVTSLRVTVSGGGGGGSSGAPGNSGGQGGSGTFIVSVTPGGTFNYAVGAGGVAAASGSTNISGASGGNTTFIGSFAGGGSSSNTSGSYNLDVVSGATILADYRSGFQSSSDSISTGRRTRGSGTTAEVFAVANEFPAGAGGAGTLVNAATGTAAAAGGVGGMVVIEYIDIA